MTLIQPKSAHTIFFRIIISGSLVLLGSVVALIVTYNQTVNMRHAVANAREALNTTQAQNAQLKEQIFAILNSDGLESFARERNLVREKKPHYLEVGTKEQWAFVSP